MELETLTIIAPLLLSMSHNRYVLCRKLLWPASVFQFILVLSCLCLCFATCEPCPTNGIKKSAKFDACGSYGVDQGLGFQDIVIGDPSSGNVIRSSATHLTIGSVCANPNLFCFPSTLPGFLSEEHKLKRDALEVSRIWSNSPLSEGSTGARRMPSNETWSSDYGMFGILNDKTVSCSLNFKEYRGELSSIQTDIVNQNDFSSCRGTLPNQKSTNFRLKKHSAMSKPGSLDVSSSPTVEITPPVLDWGKKYLFLPSVAFLTVANSCNDSILHVYEPFSTNTQFYPCNFSEILLGPGEMASICFVFLPRWVGLSKSHLILQTSSGGFLVSAKGFGMESPYKIRPLMNLDAPSSGRLSKNFSLFNPFDEAIHVEEVTAWISVSIGNTTYHTEAICSVENFLNSNESNLLSVKDWLFVNSGQVDFPFIAMRPHNNWEIGSYSAESIMEIDFSLGMEGKIYGAICLQMLRSSHNKSDTVMVPLEVDLDMKADYDDLTGPISVSLLSLVAHDIGRTVAISLRNKASYMLKVVGITEVADTKLFHIKYMEGLLLLPGTVTQVAVVTCIQMPVDLDHNSHPEVSSINRNCKLLILTNDSCSPQSEIPCLDVVNVCSRHQKDLSAGHEREDGVVESGNKKTGSWGDGMKLPSRIEALEAREADELVLQNWKSQGTSSMSVLDDHEVVFPVVEVGNHHAKWITVKNPSQQPVVMQLILNSGEIIDECRGTDGFIQPPSSGSLGHSKSTRPTRYGFSIVEGALMEAYVHPYGRASFGPILFHPSDRCAWRSSALIRNNLSGVEWLSLRGIGGSLSLVLFEGSEPVESLEFDLNLLIPQNLTPPDMLFHMEDTAACSQLLSKELYAKNTGDVPLEVRSIEVSGTECRMDGFRVHTCTGFSLEPGESTKLLISYQADFSAAMVHRDLELALTSGILVIPMKASLPVFMYNFCRISVFWMRLKKFFIAVLSVLLLLLVFSCLYFPLGFQDYQCKSEKNSTNAMRSVGKSSGGHHNHRNSKIAVPAKMDCLLKSVKEDKASQPASTGGYPDGANGDREQHVNSQLAKPTLEDCRNTDSFSETPKERAPSLPSKAIVVENNDTTEASPTGNLTIRTGKEKGRRRRKRKGAAAVLTSWLEVSSSQSGNSTPSSPLSPVSSLTPNRACAETSADVDESTLSRNPFSQMADKQCGKVEVPEPPSQVKISEPQPPLRYCSNNCHFSKPEQNPPLKKVASKHVLSQSATFPSAGKAPPGMFCPSSPLASTSTIAPHARAPGPKLCNQKSIKGKQAGFGDEYKYDIWGDHLSGLGVIGSSKDITAVNSSATVNYSDSFFVSGPQALATNTQSRSVSSNQKG